MTYKPVMGLEVHVQAQTNSKMFCRCDANYFGAEPNTHTCPVCLGLPGALPVPNKAALEQCMRVALALNCKIHRETKFDRKNYFYPDLPKGYQISQYDQPVGFDGYLEIDVDGDARRIRIRRVHMEEDTGKSVHGEGKTYLDYNKSGVPLIEIVTEPDFEDVREVTTFAKLLKQTVQYLGVSEAEMQKGQMRFELNISVRKPDEEGLPNYKVEVKNIGSISVLEKVAEYEIQRQTAVIETEGTEKNQTRGIRDLSGKTYFQRAKEAESDYRYFPEPDIPPIHIEEDWLGPIQDALPELPAARKARFVKAWGLEPEQAEVLIEQREKGEWIEKLARLVSDPNLVKEAVKWFIGDISGLLEKKGIDFTQLPVTPEDLLFLVQELAEHKISGTIAKKVLEIMFTDGGSAEEIIKAKSLEQVSDSGQIQTWCKQVIAENTKAVESISRNPNAIKALVGQVMKLSKGQANPQLVDQTLRELLQL